MGKHRLGVIKTIAAAPKLQLLTKPLFIIQYLSVFIMIQRWRNLQLTSWKCQNVKKCFYLTLGLFFFIFYFQGSQIIWILLLTGFQQQTTGVGSDHSTNWATTTTPPKNTNRRFPKIKNEIRPNRLENKNQFGVESCRKDFQKI